jgi:monothiol glutaredoxin
LDDLVKTHKVVLFMKGTRRSPACGFSATVVGILDDLIPTYETVDVLGSPELRDGIKVYSEWPTIPQLYIDGTFVGGCDIVREMSASGALAKALGVNVAEVAPPALTVSEGAAKAFREAREGDGDELRLEIDARFEPQLYFGPKQAGDVETTAAGVTFYMDRATARRANGVSIDFVEGPSGAGFKIDNPNAPPRVLQIGPAELKAMMDRGEAFELLDVRTERERAIAKLPTARHLDEEGRHWVEGLDKGTTLVFHCHHGGRSQAAAEHFLGQGFRKVYNLKGGIDAWSAVVDPSVARY